jgi:hypothetical protein
MDKNNLEISKVLTLSTGHVTKDIADMLDEFSTYDPLVTNCYLEVYNKNNYGWFIHTHLGTEEKEIEKLSNEIPQVLWDLMTLARDNGCAWLELDRDAERLEDLPYFDW